MKKFMGIMTAALMLLTGSLVFAQVADNEAETVNDAAPVENSEENMIAGVSDNMTVAFIQNQEAQQDIVKIAEDLLAAVKAEADESKKEVNEKIILATSFKLYTAVKDINDYALEIEKSGNTEFYETLKKEASDIEKVSCILGEVKTDEINSVIQFIKDFKVQANDEETTAAIEAMKSEYLAKMISSGIIEADKSGADVKALAKELKASLKEEADDELKNYRKNVYHEVRKNIVSYREGLKSDISKNKKAAKKAEEAEKAQFTAKAAELKAEYAASKTVENAGYVLSPLTFNEFLNIVDDWVWGIPTIILILLTGLLLTVRLRCVQFSKLGLGIKSLFKKPDGGKGELSPFQALCTALSATIGTGNIVGVATAIAAGGPGALFWMWFAALLGTATKYAECMLAVKYREHAEDGHVLGGPFYTIEKGMKEVTGFSWKWLAVLFAVFGVLAGLLGIGTMTQINGITSAVNNAFDPNNANVAFTIFGNSYSWATVISGVLVTVGVALVVIGGLKRIAKVAEKVVPTMAVVYVFLGLSIIIMNATKIPGAFAVIFKSAFGWSAVAGGAMGYVFKQITDSMQKGIARGIFSNEAGLGSAPIAASAAKVDEPVEQGVVSMLGTFIDTIIVCTMTGLAIVIAFYTGDNYGNPDGLKGVALTAAAFNKVLGGDGHSVQFLLMLCLVFFAFTTILGWDYYSEKCLEYLTHGNMTVVMIFRWLYIIAVAIGPYFTVNAVFTIADITNGLMAIPNCISLIVLSGVAAKETKDYFDKKKAMLK